MDSPVPLLSFRGVVFRFPGGPDVLRGVTVDIMPGKTYLVAGPNGSGKTVLAKHMTGLLVPVRGELLLRGQGTNRRSRRPFPGIGMVFQNSAAQFIGQTVLEDVSFGPVNRGFPPEDVREKVRQALDEMEIGHLERRNPRMLSGGEQRRCAVAGILAMDPELIILDEPFTGLDYPGVVDLLSAIEKLKERGKSLIILTHHVEKVTAHTDWILLLRGGRIERAGPPEETVGLFGNFGLVPADKPWRDLSWLPGYRAV